METQKVGQLALVAANNFLFMIACYGAGIANLSFQLLVAIFRTKTDFIF